MPTDLLARDDAHLFRTYRRIPLHIVRGEGVYLWTREGGRYLDMFAGVAVNALGHAHPRVVQAIFDQARRYIHVSNYFAQEPQVALAELLVRYGGLPRVFFTNSGTEAIEGTIKIARRWGAAHGKTGLVALSNAFHGRSTGALSLMDRPKYRDGFEPLLPACASVQHNSVTSLRSAVTERTAAVVLECIQGEGGIRPVTKEFVETLTELRHHYGFLVVADEIQSGLGRTGTFFGFEHFGLAPDIITLAKPLGGGLPLGAILATDAVATVLTPGSHGTTFGGNPVACAAGVALIHEIIDQNLLDNADRMGHLLRTMLTELAREFPHLIREVRGYGLMVGCELSIEGDPVVNAMRDRNVLINCTDTTVLRFIPPLTIEAIHIDETIRALRDVLASIPDKAAAEAIPPPTR